jgi:hypothetical protein
MKFPEKILLILTLIISTTLASAGEVSLEGVYDPRPGMAALEASKTKATPTRSPNRKRTIRPGAGSHPITQMQFQVFGDSKLNPPFVEVLNRADALNPDFCITTADLVSIGAGETGIKQYAELDKQGGWFFKKYPTWPTIGNHELSWNKSDPLKDQDHADGYHNFASFFNIDQPKYSFTYGNAKFIAMDWPKIEAGTPEFAWLENELKTGAGKHLFIFKHRPYYTVGNKTTSDVAGEASAVTRLFSKYKVDAVFSGHDHIYYRTKRDGVYYVISAGAGAPIYPLKREFQALEADVYYGKNTQLKPGTGKKNYTSVDERREDLEDGEGYRFHSGQGKPDVEFPDPMHYVLSVEIDGPKVSFAMIDAKEGKVWDTFSLTH